MFTKQGIWRNIEVVVPLGANLGVGDKSMVGTLFSVSEPEGHSKALQALPDTRIEKAEYSVDFLQIKHKRSGHGLVNIEIMSVVKKPNGR